MPVRCLRFGRYVGEDIEIVPPEYLTRLAQEMRTTLELVEEELERRRAVEEANLDWSMKIVEAGYRALAKKHHPDAGGNPKEFREVKAAHTQLLVILEEVKNLK